MRLRMPARLSSLVTQTQVFFTLALGAWWMHDRLRPYNVAGGLVATAGMILLGAHKVSEGASSTFVGFLLVIAAAVGWAIGNIMAKRMMHGRDDEMLGLVVWSSLVPPIPLALLSYAFEG